MGTTQERAAHPPRRTRHALDLRIRQRRGAGDHRQVPDGLLCTHALYAIRASPGTIDQRRLRFLLGYLHDDDVKKYAAAFGVDMADGKEGE